MNPQQMLKLAEFQKLGNRSYKNEAALTDALGQKIESEFSPALPVWRGRKPGSKLSPEHHEQYVDEDHGQRFDLSWCSKPAQATPNHCNMLKLVKSTSTKQSFTKFLSDVAAAAWLKRHNPAIDTHAIAIIEKACWERDPWQLLKSTKRLIIDPQNVKGSGEIDFKGDYVRPMNVSDIDVVMTRGTNTRLVGFYRRPGKVHIHFTAAEAPFGSLHHALILSIRKACFYGLPKDHRYEDWLP